jgi:hypothetical protein
MDRLRLLLKEYAVCIRMCGLELSVDDLFDGSLYDMGFAELDDALSRFPEQEVRVLATQIFSPLEGTPILYRQDATYPTLTPE